MVHDAADVEEAIAKMLRGVDVLVLSSKDVDDDDARALSDALRVNTTLTRLVLSGNAIGPIGAASLAAALAVNSTLVELDLACNDVGDAGTTALADALKVNTTLTALWLSSYSIGGKGAISLAAALVANTTLTRLSLVFNTLGPAGASALANAFKVNTTVNELRLTAQPSSDVGALQHAPATSTCPEASAAALGTISTNAHCQRILSAIESNRAIMCSFAALNTPDLADLLSNDFASPPVAAGITLAQAQHSFIARLVDILRDSSGCSGAAPEARPAALASKALQGPLRDHPASHALRKWLPGFVI
jgi:hypothetical protein